MLIKKPSNNFSLAMLLLVLVSTVGCITSQRSEALRNELKTSAVADLKSAANDVKKIALADLTRETVEKMSILDNQYRSVIEVLQDNNVDSVQSLVDASEKYMKERDRVRTELIERAQFYTKLVIKIDNGWLSIESLERMSQITEETRRNLFADVATKDLPMVLASMYAGGKIDPDFLNVISQSFGSVVQVESTKPAETK